MSYQEYVFPMREALIDGIVSRFNGAKWTPLTPTHVELAFPNAEDRQIRGVYVLGQSVDRQVDLKYVGQSEEAVYRRLKRHADFVQDRCGMPNGSVYFKALGVIIFDSVSLESGLLSNYRDQVRWDRRNPLSGWNLGGLGSNDTGVGRDRQRPSGFDRRFPIDINIQKQGLLDVGTITAKRFFQTLSSRLPYTVRLPNDLQNHPDLLNIRIEVAENHANASFRECLDLFLAALPPTWSVQVFPGRVVLAHNATDAPGTLLNPNEWPPQVWLDTTTAECPLAVFRAR